MKPSKKVHSWLDIRQRAKFIAHTAMSLNHRARTRGIDFVNTPSAPRPASTADAGHRSADGPHGRNPLRAIWSKGDGRIEPSAKIKRGDERGTGLRQGNSVRFRNAVKRRGDKHVTRFWPNEGRAGDIGGWYRK